MSQDNCQDNNPSRSPPNSDAQLANDIIHRWQNKQSIRSIARELGLNRFQVARIIRAHQLSTELPAADDPSAAAAPPPSLGPAPVLRGSKLDRFEEQLQQLLERCPRITAKRVYEELHRLGYDGGYSILRVRVKQLRARPAKPLTIRFETAPGVQAQMDWSTYEIERYAELGPVGSQFLEGLLAKQRYGKHDAQRVLSLLHAYSLQDILAAMSRAIQYHAYGYQSLERILAHLGTPKPSWEVLSDKEQDVSGNA